MAAIKIIFEEEDHKYMKQYKDAHGVSIQRFVTSSVKKMIEELKADQIIKDQKLK